MNQHRSTDRQRTFRDIVRVLALEAERDEEELAYGSTDGEGERQKTGSYYTPRDVANFFWRQYFFASGQKTEINDLLTGSDFLEPAVGAGALFWGFLEYIADNPNLDLSALERARFFLFDINKSALDYVYRGLERIRDASGVNLKGVRLHHGDFIDTNLLADGTGHLVIFGNPPFSRNPVGALHKNAFADFLSKSLDMIQDRGSINFIVPLSLCFSRDYSQLRKKIRERKRDAFFSNFDNIPDTLFKSGKPKNKNTNKANSQRCSIITITSIGTGRIFSTDLIRWPKGQRSLVLSRVANFFDCSNYSLDDQFPRPSSPQAIDAFASWSTSIRLADMVTPDGSFPLHIGSVARNFIAFRDLGDSASVAINFGSEEQRAQALALISSREFYEYWRTVGDGFHVTLGNILSFPLSQELLQKASKQAAMYREIWNNRATYSKIKMNAGKAVRSYDFSKIGG